MKGYLTSYAGLSEERQSADSPVVDKIEIPLIQRDYAQGRLGADVEEIRVNFLEVLLDAVAGKGPVGLDFVYGKVKAGTLRPLDGQQRLTTLFLLHWYLASAAGRLDPKAPWTRFSYATRPSARLFCERLATNPMPSDVTAPSDWIRDQSWYLYTWRDDPTIQAMLVMIDAIHCELRRLHPDFDPMSAWERLTDDTAPAISFYLLPLEDMESDEDLYIKMNSRGKPLTPFESFKARFEKDIADSHRAGEFAHKVDGPWSDLLWPIHGGDHIVDDEFMRYLDYITEICELRDGQAATGKDIRRRRIGPRARAVFGDSHPKASEHLSFLFDAFDTWLEETNIGWSFDGVFSLAEPGQEGYDPSKVVLFGATNIDLFEQCCHQFDSQPDGNRPFTLQSSLYLYAVLLHLIKKTEDFPRRIRTLRNLVAASSEDEVRRQNMPALLADVERVIVEGHVDAVVRFSTNQVEDEKLKQRFLAAHPELTDTLFRLEDHPLLRGTLSAFDLDATNFRHRAEAFEKVMADPAGWMDLTGALLAAGDYQRTRGRSEAWQFGTSSTDRDSVWRYLFTNATRDALNETRAVLGRFLDDFHTSGAEPLSYFRSVIQAWLAKRERELHFDWRYYLVKYPSMRSGASGVYYGEDGVLGYSLCMLRTNTLRGLFRDPILLGVWESSGIGEMAEDPWFRWWWAYPRWLRLVRSGVGMRSVGEGYELAGPEDEGLKGIFNRICEARGNIETGDRILLKIPQASHDATHIDSIDRVVEGADFLRDVMVAGL